MRKLLISTLFLFVSLSAAYPVSNQIDKQAERYRELGYGYQQKGNLREALSFYQKAVQIDPTYKEAFNDLGVIYEKKGTLNRAEEAYLKAIEIDKDYLAPYANLGYLYEKKRDYQRASYYWEKRYEMGKEGSYWRKKAKEHLLALDTYLPFKKEKLRKEAFQLAQQLEEEREQKRSKVQRHLDLGREALSQGLYEQALKELSAVREYEDIDQELIEKANEFSTKARKYQRKERIRGYLENGINYLEENNYLALMKELNKALDLILEAR